MTDREKLIELIQSAVGGCARHWAELIADHLIANGVCFAGYKEIVPVRGNETEVRVEGVIRKNPDFNPTKEQLWGMAESMRKRLRKQMMDELVKNGSLKEVLHEENGEMKMQLGISVNLKSGWGFGHDNPSNWMPLPEPPKEE